MSGTQVLPAGLAAPVHQSFPEDIHGELVWSALAGRVELQMWRHLRVLPDGRSFHQHRLVESGGLPGVVVIPVTASGQIGLTHQWRPTVGAWMWELPRGFGESADPTEDARRELAEETGLDLLAATHLGKVFANTGLLSGYAHVVRAKVNLDIAQVSERDDDPDIGALRFVSRDTLKAMICAGEVADGFTLSALTLADALG